MLDDAIDAAKIAAWFTLLGIGGMMLEDFLNRYGNLPGLLGFAGLFAIVWLIAFVSIVIYHRRR